MYADDTQLYMSFYPSEWAVVKAKMETCIGEIRDWLRKNHLKLNDKKTEVMIACKNNLRSKIADEVFISIGDAKILPKMCVKNLGGFLDSEMTMQQQVSNVCKSSYASIHNLSRIRRYLDEENMKTLVHAFVTCRVDSLNILLTGVSNNAQTMNRLQMILNTSARLIYRLKKNDHITEVLKKLHWLPIEARIQYKILLLTFKSLNGTGPAYIREMLHFKVYNRNTRASADCLKLEKPCTKLKSLGDRAFSSTSVELWNSLPFELRASETLCIFKTNLKTFLFRKFYP